jgi:hypothetical protein
MTTKEIADVLAGTHWLCSLSEELAANAQTRIDEMEAWDWPAGEIALAIIEGAQLNGVTQESKLHIRCYPWEKRRILKAARGCKLNDWIREAVIERAMKGEE